MAERPVYVSMERAPYVRRVDITFDWNSGFAKIQKQKNIIGLHHNFKRMYPEHDVLEISSKSMQKHGEDLSAFFLQKYVPSLERKISVECIYQGSKVFKSGGPFTDLYLVKSHDAKTDDRIKNSGPIIGFRFENVDYPVNPTNLFYNFIYMNALLDNEELAEAIMKYDSFTDIEFNPNRSLNCQALAAAAFVGISRAGKRDKIRNFDTFLELFNIRNEKKKLEDKEKSSDIQSENKKAVKENVIIKPGSVIAHKTYGNGIVKALEATVVVVDFPEAGERNLGLKWVQSNCDVHNEDEA